MKRSLLHCFNPMIWTMINEVFAQLACLTPLVCLYILLGLLGRRKQTLKSKWHLWWNFMVLSENKRCNNDHSSNKQRRFERCNIRTEEKTHQKLENNQNCKIKIGAGSWLVLPVQNLPFLKLNLYQGSKHYQMCNSLIKHFSIAIC